MTDRPEFSEAERPPPEIAWAARVMCAVRELEEAAEFPATVTRVKEAVGAKFAAAFLPADRLFDGGRPSWERRVDDAVKALTKQRYLRRLKGALRTTAAGRAHYDTACRLGALVAAAPAPTVDTAPAPPDLLQPGVVTAPLRGKLRPQGPGARPEDVDEEQPADEAEPVMIELNLRYGIGAKPPIPGGLGAAIARVEYLWTLVGAQGKPRVIADQYLSGELTPAQMQNIATADSAAGDWPYRAIYRIWPDFEVHRQIDVSTSTVKAVPAQRSFAAFGDGIVWAVIDSGIDGTHPHFKADRTLDDPAVNDLHHDFVSGSKDPGAALVDEDGHGTHVAGIIAGGLTRWKPDKGEPHAIAVERRRNNGAVAGNDPILSPRPVQLELLNGVAPLAKLVSLKVLGGLGDLTTRTGRVIEALAYIRETNGDTGKLSRIHGVNLSLGYDFLAEWFACGQSPLCLEVNRLVRTGVVVVVAAGNSGYVKLNVQKSDVNQFSAAVTINDPGNAELAITVGSTHRDSPHTNGISYFSSRGPTGDGRPKPDLVAPGELITSAAAGKNLTRIQQANFEGLDGAAVYIQDSGTSMAAPHVSGAIAAFLSVQREFVGKPDEVKRIFTSSATSLNRDPSFQGAGLVDLMRALQTR
ncbi:S8 family peptidase [Mycobacterium sp. UM_Kg1]|uniref:S8 family peptidase n=1 Tax=Mycobacterium sp. UM_Kg1 TaxID=1545691 RepID=UPI0009E20C63|nr:S8 family peptidase [Mycobacterium sp. UM_Kg1]